MGAYHALHFFFRCPANFDGVIGLSGLYHAGNVCPNYVNGVINENSPNGYVRDMSWHHEFSGESRDSDIILCCGRGRWEVECIEGSGDLKKEFARLQVPVWLDFWGYAVDHDRPSWKVQFPYFLQVAVPECNMLLNENIYIESFKLRRTLPMYLPAEIQPDERFPVIYMFDGHRLFNDSDATDGESWGIKDALDTHNQRVNVAGIECNHEGNVRLCEFSPYSFKDKFFGEVTGRGKTTIVWMCETLKPCLDAKFPTKPDKGYTAIGGGSMGGLVSVCGLAARSDIFSMGMCVSPFYAHVL